MSRRDDIGGYGGPSDDGVGVAAWRMAAQLDHARGEFIESGGRVGTDSVTPVVEALSAALESVVLVPVAEAAERPVRAQAEARELGWSARSRRRP